MSIRSTFYGIEIGKAGLAVSQSGLDVSGHNIANVETLGYTRQRIVNTAYDPYNATMKWRPVSGALVGGGADVLSHNQIRNIYLDRTFRTQQSVYSTAAIRDSSLGYLEKTFEGPKGSFELSNAMGGLFTSIFDFTKDGAESASAKTVLANGQNIVGSVNNIYDQLIYQQKNHNLAVKDVVNDINTIAEGIRDLNEAIYRYEASGTTALDLRDQRNLLVDQLSALVDIEYAEYSDTDNPMHTKLQIKIGDTVLVDHKERNTLGVMEKENIIPGEDMVYEVIWETMDGKPTYHSAANDVNNLIELIANNQNNPVECAGYVNDLKQYLSGPLELGTDGSLTFDGRVLIDAEGNVKDRIVVETVGGFNYPSWSSDDTAVSFKTSFRNNFQLST